MICRFYPAYTVDKVMKLTFREFFMLNRNVNKISKLENPEAEEEKPIEGTFENLKMAGLISGKKKKKRK